MAVKRQKRRDAQIELGFLENFDHVNVVKCLGSKSNGKDIDIVLELCHSSLHDIIKQHKSGFPEHELIKFMTDFLCGYGYLRDRDIAHLDIKAKNILIDFDGNYKIADFGLSEIAPNGTKLSQIAGSYDYCHPVLFEMLNWRKLYPKDKRPTGRTWPATVDIWSFGVLLFEMTNGSLPFKAKSHKTMLKVSDPSFHFGIIFFI